MVELFLLDVDGGVGNFLFWGFCYFDFDLLFYLFWNYDEIVCGFVVEIYDMIVWGRWIGSGIEDDVCLWFCLMMGEFFCVCIEMV